MLTDKINENTEIIGLENILSVSGGAIITVNHFNIVDNTVIRYLTMKCGREKGLNIIVQESNIFMKGFFGFLMKNGYTLPVSSNLRYMQKNLRPALKEILGRGDTVLIYPEQEMWFNYKKPRPPREGAYQFAYEMNVPIIPCFIEMREMEDIDQDGFKRIKHILHVMTPIYPNVELSPREGRQELMQKDYNLKIACYESAYGIKYDNSFIPARDIAGYNS
jgi:1-acyl-sn-glycerol-3-phosphate acyltransferase